MEIWKASERVVSGGVFRKAIREAGGIVKELGEFSKWANLVNGGRLQKTLTIYELGGRGGKMYLVCDSLDRAVCEMQFDKKEVFEYLKEHGWKTTKNWYMEDCGMSEETWNIWNGNGEEEE